MTRPAATLHYIHDPLCGWCYGVAPLVRAARAVLPVQAHGGGMMAAAQRQRVSPELRAFVQPHDQRIAALSGQVFGAAYADGLLADTTAVLDSGPPIAAVLAAEALVGTALALDLLGRLQTAHYVDGLQIAREDVLVALAEGLGLDGAAFAAALRQAQAQQLAPHLAATRALMDRVGARGFPTFVLDIGGVQTSLAWQRHLGQPLAFAADLRARLAAAGVGAATSAS